MMEDTGGVRAGAGTGRSIQKRSARASSAWARMPAQEAAPPAPAWPSGSVLAGPGDTGVTRLDLSDILVRHPQASLRRPTLAVWQPQTIEADAAAPLRARGGRSPGELHLRRRQRGFACQRALTFSTAPTVRWLFAA